MDKLLGFAKVDESNFDCALRVKEELEEIKDLVRFMCATWTDIDKFVYENCFNLDKYPVIQGTKNQINLSRIGEQSFSNESLPRAVNQLLGKD